ncbi:site-specific recombinase [Thermosynechococcus sp. NK55a]|jgi:integrase|uniref:site-specific integrase n=1 Tax=unclassified Thermosynechococcus TaxID=2622553 RepID=UPI0003D8AAC0|nr:MULTISPECIES: site-specific integrase [unclassified Thermosynechococcus]AHB88826.1 site-specific recombinase [Thermosynechococcus sp. NK55a]HIK23264.1 site-specific integrase [Thermosynechococcus sp. M3746_W2019_013]
MATSPQKLDQQLQQVNQRLKLAQLGLQIEQRGQRLSLRGTLPPRPGSHRLRPHQQRLSLGLPATPSGLKAAEKAAKIIAAKLLENTFRWQDYERVKGLGRLGELSLGEQIAAFETAWLAQGNLSRTTWETAYLPYLRQLLKAAAAHPDYSLAELIYGLLQQIPADQRQRQVACTAFQGFCRFLGVALPIPLAQFWGTYSRRSLQPRELPSDEEILAAYQQIPNPQWRYVYGLMATYGLRNHEVFFCDLSGLVTGDPQGMIEVQETTKTGCHQVWPFPPQWVEVFGLRSPQLPRINTDLTKTTLQRIGQRVNQQFRRYGLPFRPYDLRHAWAVRTIHYGLPDTVAARMMGHSVAIHTQTYHRWLTLRDQRQAVTRVLTQCEYS